VKIHLCVLVKVVTLRPNARHTTRNTAQTNVAGSPPTSESWKSITPSETNVKARRGTVGYVKQRDCQDITIVPYVAVVHPERKLRLMIPLLACWLPFPGFDLQ
jgi:hypothetical protein